MILEKLILIDSPVVSNNLSLYKLIGLIPAYMPETISSHKILFNINTKIRFQKRKPGFKKFSFMGIQIVRIKFRRPFYGIYQVRIIIFQIFLHRHKVIQEFFFLLPYLSVFLHDSCHLLQRDSHRFHKKIFC